MFLINVAPFLSARCSPPGRAGGQRRSGARSRARVPVLTRPRSAPSHRRTLAPGRVRLFIAPFPGRVPGGELEQGPETKRTRVLERGQWPRRCNDILFFFKENLKRKATTNKKPVNGKKSKENLNSETCFSSDISL